MLLARFVVLVLLGAGLVCFTLYATTGRQRYRELGVRIVKWTVIAGLGFFAVLIAERMATIF
ncbi:MAG: hypothetical protein KGL99_04150 [Burkholderiales bacterium]|nr:hypothetical protein [Burkholderiales bacterium]MDE2298415.1 hypothetical protein [Burkholderiales bacterium]MDE2626324.1 hypothetical protein [Burkholderiales bacterium]